MTGEFTLPARGKNIKFRICTWSWKRFCELESVSLTKVLSGGYMEDMSFETALNFLKAAAEYDFVVTRKIPIDWDDIDLMDWIDEAGGIADVYVLQHKAMTESTNVPGVQEKKSRSHKEKLTGQK